MRIDSEVSAAHRADVDTDTAVDTDKAVERPIVIRVPRWFALAVGLTGLWIGLLWVSMMVMTGAGAHRVALFVHLASMVVGFGAVLTVDFQAMMWAVGRRRLPEVLRFGQATHALIWAGLAGLAASGVALSPELGNRWTQLKMVLVLVVALNGINALRIQRRIDRLGEQRPKRRLVGRAIAAGMISQLAWWGAMGIGFANREYRADPMPPAPVVEPGPAAKPTAPAVRPPSPVSTKQSLPAGKLPVRSTTKTRPSPTPQAMGRRTHSMG